METYEAFQLYISIKYHFTGKNYDYFKYGGRVDVSMESLLVRKDLSYFRIASERYKKEQFLDLAVANFLLDRTWIGDFLDSEGQAAYHEYIKNRSSLGYVFKEDVQKLFKNCKDPFGLDKKNAYPKVVRMVISKQISFWTFCILDDLFHFSESLNKKYDSNDMIWPPLEKKKNKFLPFIEYDKEKFRKCVPLQ